MEETTRPPRVVGKLGATLMSVNGMIGAGIFALPALLYAEVGNFAPWMFLIFGMLFAAGILISARLSNMFRSSGGPQLWTQVAFGPFVGFQVGWIMVLAMAAGRAATLYVLVSYLAVIFPVFHDSSWRVAALATLVLAVTWLTISGMKNSVGGLAVGTVLKVTPILLLCVLAYASGGIATEYSLPRFGAFESVALLVYFAFSGANSSSYSAGEFKNPRRDLPITMLTSLAVIIVFYMAVQWAYIAAGAPQSVGNATPLSAAASAVMGDSGALLLDGGSRPVARDVCPCVTALQDARARDPAVFSHRGHHAGERRFRIPRYGNVAGVAIRNARVYLGLRATDAAEPWRS